MAPAAAYDIDTYLNHIIPRSRLYLLPTPISRFLGYRAPTANPQKPKHPLLVWAWSFIGAFCGVAIIEAIYLHLPRLGGHQVPLVIASFGAAAILEYNTIDSPLAQPRNLVFGHFLSALVGICITKLFELLPHDGFESLRWLAGALAVGCASVLMSATKTVHPPAGATALLTASTAEITELGWWVLPLVLLGTLLMLTSALILNNIHRRFPVYWWTPADLSKVRDRKAKPDVERASDVIKQITKDTPPSLHTDVETLNEGQMAAVKSGSQLVDEQDERLSVSMQSEIAITKERLVLPDWMEVSDWEMNVLQIFQQKLSSGPRQNSTTTNDSTGSTAVCSFYRSSLDAEK